MTSITKMTANVRTVSNASPFFCIAVSNSGTMVKKKNKVIPSQVAKHKATRHKVLHMP